jgi:two-component system OmpR family response regulator
MARMMRGVALIVEDDPHLQRAMSEHLVAMDFEVRVALHYEAAVGHLTTAGEPSLVCVDIELPTQSGYEVCEYIRGSLGLRRVPILVTSDSGFPEDRACAEEAGANAFLKKPFSMREFGSYVEALLGEAHHGRPGARQPRS